MWFPDVTATLAAVGRKCSRWAKSGRKTEECKFFFAFANSEMSTTFQVVLKLTTYLTSQKLAHVFKSLFPSEIHLLKVGSCAQTLSHGC